MLTKIRWTSWQINKRSFAVSLHEHWKLGGLSNLRHWKLGGLHGGLPNLQNKYPHARLFIKIAPGIVLRFTDDNDVFNLFAYFFQSICTKCSSVINKNYPYPLSHLNSIFKPVIDVPDVLQSLDTLRLQFSPGPDRIPSYLLRNCSSYLALPLTLTLNLSSSQGRFPSMEGTLYCRIV